ncbi:MAG: hypothetical protein PSX37_10030 [bacterium]|nr:hypothetical protein [bacterium]
MAVSDPRARELKSAAKKADEWRTKRDELIREARAEGASLREIGALVGMSHAGVLKVLGRSGPDVDLQWTTPGSPVEELVIDMLDQPES